MQLLKKVGRSIFFDVNPISQPVTGCAQSSKTFCCISLLEIDLSVPYQPLYPTPPLYVRYSQNAYGYIIQPIFVFALSCLLGLGIFLKSQFLTLWCTPSGRELSDDTNIMGQFDRLSSKQLFENSKNKIRKKVYSRFNNSYAMARDPRIRPSEARP